MDKHQFFKEHYFFEANRRHQLTNALAIPIAILSVLGGALIVVAKHLDAPIDYIEVFEIIFFLSSAALIAITIYYLIRSYFNYSYGYIATPKELKKYYEQMISYYGGDDDAIRKADSELEEYVNAQYAEHTHRNTENNDRKSFYIHKANGFLIASIITAFIGGIPYVIDSIIKPNDIHRVQLINSEKTGEKAMAEDKKSEPTRQEKRDRKPVEKPEPPPGRIIKEGEDPKKGK